MAERLNTLTPSLQPLVGILLTVSVQELLCLPKPLLHPDG